jgi:ATP synthase protein I
MGNTSAITRPFRVIFSWQIVATAVLAVVSARFAGTPGALSALLGGLVAVMGGLAYCLLLPRRTAATPWDAMGSLLRAEGAKVGVIVVLLWLVLKLYQGLVVVGFIGTFTVSVIIFSLAIFVRNPVSLNSGENHVS